MTVLKNGGLLLEYLATVWFVFSCHFIWIFWGYNFIWPVRSSLCYCSVAKSRVTPCDPHGLQHARLLYPSLSPRVDSNSSPLSQWCHTAISSSVVLSSSYLQSSPASGSFPMSWLFTSSDQSIGASPSASALPM